MQFYDLGGRCSEYAPWACISLWAWLNRFGRKKEHQRGGAPSDTSQSARAMLRKNVPAVGHESLLAPTLACTCGRHLACMLRQFGFCAKRPVCNVAFMQSCLLQPRSMMVCVIYLMPSSHSWRTQVPYMEFIIYIFIYRDRDLSQLSRWEKTSSVYGSYAVRVALATFNYRTNKNNIYIYFFFHIWKVHVWIKWQITDYILSQAVLIVLLIK